MSFDWTINVGHIISVFVGLGGALAYLQRKLAILDELLLRLGALERMFGDVRGSLTELSAAIHSLDRRVTVLETIFQAAQTRRKTKP